MVKREGEVICVTGGSGFIGRGYTVHATVKNLGDERETKHLEAMEGADSRLRLFQMDLLNYDSIVAAVSGASGVIHVASPCFVDQVHDPQQLKAINVLTAAKELEVRRVVATTSISAMAVNANSLADTVYNEDCGIDEEYCRNKGDLRYLKSSLWDLCTLKMWSLLIYWTMKTHQLQEGTCVLNLRLIMTTLLLRWKNSTLSTRLPNGLLKSKDASKKLKDLGLEFISLEQTIRSGLDWT